jgi:uncharacterized protein YaeQ
MTLAVRWRGRPAPDPKMALTSTIHTFEIELAHVDRGVYETLSFRVARHPSESAEYLVTRVLAYCLEYTDGIGFSKGGLSDPDEPAVFVRDLTGAWRAWIDVGVPDAARLHKATRTAPRVAVYTHKDPGRLLRLLSGERIHRRDELELFSVDQQLVADWAARLERRMTLELSVSDGHAYVGIGSASISGAIERLALS